MKKVNEGIAALHEIINVAHRTNALEQRHFLTDPHFSVFPLSFLSPSKKNLNKSNLDAQQAKTWPIHHKVVKSE